MDNIIDLFFSKQYENDLNTRILENEYVLSIKGVLAYILEINEIGVEEYMQWLDTHFCSAYLTTEDAIQYSSFNDVTKRIAEVMINAGDEGYSHLEIGKLLQDDGIDRSEGTYTKYGENHAKTATYLGYLFSIKRCYYVSAIGYVLSELSSEEQEKLFIRLFLRTNLFKSVYYLAKNGKISMREVFDMLSKNTYVRRRSNIKFFFQKLNGENCCKAFLENITY